jgi:uncharacterized protein (DUF1697 family)
VVAKGSGGVHIGLLRAVNIGPHNQVAMSDLRELLAGAGMREPQTLLQSGNVVFRTSGATARLELLLESAAKKRLGLTTAFFVRTAAEWQSLVGENPFTKQASSDPGHLLVVFLKEEPPPAAVAALRASIKGREIVEVNGREAYIVYPDGVGRSKLTSALIEQKLGTRGTGRNWNTVTKLAALAGV